MTDKLLKERGDECFLKTDCGIVSTVEGVLAMGGGIGEGGTSEDWIGVAFGGIC